MGIDKSLVSGSMTMLLLMLLEEKDMYCYEMIETLGERSNNKHILLDLLFVLALIMIPFQTTFGILGIVVLIIYNIITYFK